jgi:alkylation response protein AidB-like acyl-CoA dehydrogenase
MLERSAVLEGGATLQQRVAALRAAGDLTLPLPGKGKTALRHLALRRWGHQDLSLARIAEAHTDASAILAEAGRRGSRSALYGVWASDGPAGRLSAERIGTGRWLLNGIKQFCSGATFLEAALVTAHDGADVLLFDVSLRDPAIQALPSQWKSTGLADTATVAVKFSDVEVEDARQVGGVNWYLQRPGFWHGALGPAACWAGGAMCLIEAATGLRRKDPHSRAQLGALQALGWGFHAMLEQAGREIDADPQDRAGEARVRALKVRHLIERACTEVLDRFGRATGPQLLAHDELVARQYAALALYIRQCHAERDLETIPSPA